MLDLDKYINNSVKIRAFGKELDVLEPTMEMVMKVNAIESDITEENVNEKRVKIAHLFLNHNSNGMEITEEEIRRIPAEAIYALILEVSAMRYEADQNPN